MNDLPKLTQKEANDLLNMIKKTLKGDVAFPEKGTSTEFEVQGDTKNDIFIIRIYRGKIDREKYDLGARISKNGICLLELHINKNKIHINPDGEKIIGSHWHIYTETYGRRFAFKAEDIDSSKFIENTVQFLDKFNVLEKPTINFQLELI